MPMTQLMIYRDVGICKGDTFSLILHNVGEQQQKFLNG